MTGTLKAISIETYGLFDGKELLGEFDVKNVKIRRKLDTLQGQKVNFEKDIKPLLEKS